jgi:hypothetical protein
MSLRHAVALTALAVTLAAAALSPAQPARPKAAPKAVAGASLAAAHGQVVKADADAVTVRPRGADGRFEKELVLQVTGTTKVTQLTVQTRGGKPVAVQQDTDAKSLQPQQEISVIYAPVGDGLVLLSAVVSK